MCYLFVTYVPICPHTPESSAMAPKRNSPNCALARTLSLDEPRFEREGVLETEATMAMVTIMATHAMAL